jgi:putative oxidoreductase
MQQKLILTLAVAALLLWGSLQPSVGGSWLDAAGRLLLVGFFVVAGLSNLTREQIKWHIDYMGETGTPFPAAAFWIGIVLQFTGCALIVARWHPAIGVGCLIVFIIAATVIFHRFWEKKDPMQRNLARLFMLNNIAILGGLLLFLDRLPL